MLYTIGDWISFHYESEKRKTKLPVVNTHERNPTAIVLHPDWGGHTHCLLTNNYSQREINYLTAIVDPFFAAEKCKTDGELRSQLQRLQKDLNITSPQQFYSLVVKPFIHLYDGYRLYFPNKMLNIKVIKRYSDIEIRMKQPQQGQEKQPERGGKGPIAGTGGLLATNFFQNYANTLSKMKGPRLK